MDIWRFRRHGLPRFTGTQQRSTRCVRLGCFTSIRFHGQGVSNTVTGPRRDNGFGQTTVLRGGVLEEHDMRRLFAGKELLEDSATRQAGEQAELKEREWQSSDAVLHSTLKCS